MTKSPSTYRSPSLFTLFAVLTALLFLGTSSTASAASCNGYTSTTAVPSGYGASFDVFSNATNKPLVVSADCATAGYFVQVGTTYPDAGTKLAVYNKGYYWNGTSWQAYDFRDYSVSGSSDTPYFQNSSYISGAAQSTVRLPYAGGAHTYFVAYFCTSQGGVWKCGCSDSTCATSKWNLQVASNAPQTTTPTNGEANTTNYSSVSCNTTGPNRPSAPGYMGHHAVLYNETGWEQQIGPYDGRIYHHVVHTSAATPAAILAGPASWGSWIRSAGIQNKPIQVGQIAILPGTQSFDSAFIRRVLNGEFDAHMIQWAKNMRATADQFPNTRFIIFLMWEYSGYWFPWSLYVNHQGQLRMQPEEWKALWEYQYTKVKPIIGPRVLLHHSFQLESGNFSEIVRTFPCPGKVDMTGFTYYGVRAGSGPEGYAYAPSVSEQQQAWAKLKPRIDTLIDYSKRAGVYIGQNEGSFLRLPPSGNSTEVSWFAETMLKYLFDSGRFYYWGWYNTDTPPYGYARMDTRMDIQTNQTIKRLLYSPVAPYKRGFPHEP